MKRFTDIFRWLLIPLVVSMAGCFDVFVHTTISADGSCERVITVKTSSKKFPSGAFPWALDSTWTFQQKEPKDSTGQYEFIAQKRFDTPADFERAYAEKKDSGLVHIHVSLEKKFEWFYSYITYREVYSMENLFPYIPVSRYLTQEEIDRVVRGESNDTLKEKIEQWDMRNIFEEFYRSMVNEVTRRHDSTVDLSLLAEKKEQIFALLLTVDKQKKKVTTRDVSMEIADVLHSKSILSYHEFLEAEEGRISEKISQQQDNPDKWNYSVQMPGMLLETNGNSVEGNLVSWKFSRDQIHVGDFAMSATSRVTNVWAFVVAGVVVLSLLFLLIVSSFRKRKI